MPPVAFSSVPIPPDSTPLPFWHRPWVVVLGSFVVGASASLVAFGAASFVVSLVGRAGR